VGVGGWGWGIGDWGLGPIPNPQSPIPNPHPKFSSKTINIFFENKIKLILIKFIIFNGEIFILLYFLSKDNRRKF